MTTVTGTEFYTVDLAPASGTPFENGSTVEIANATAAGSDVDVVDANSDGNLDAGTDYLSMPTIPFTGYTFTLLGTEYPIFGNGPFYIVLDTAAIAVLTNDIFPITSNPHADEVSAYPFCFGAGTAIATPSGETPVEDLQIGDEISTACGGTTRVLWLGRQTLMPAFHPSQERCLVRIKAGALGTSTPNRDLLVTGDHGMIVDDLIINASALINGSSIDWEPVAKLGLRYVVYHVETENHDVILANGAASETFIDAAGRAAFDNHQEYLDLYGAERLIPEMPQPRITTKRLLPDHIAARLNIYKPSPDISNFTAA